MVGNTVKRVGKEELRPTKLVWDLEYVLNTKS